MSHIASIPSGYAHPLPPGSAINGYADLSGYAHPLPPGCTIGAAVRKARGRRSISEVARAAGLQRHQVTSIERGTRAYTVVSLLAMIPENVLVPDDDPEDECALCGEPCVGRLCRECHDELTADAAMERCD